MQDRPEGLAVSILIRALGRVRRPIPYYTLSCRSDVRCRRRIEIPVDDRHALWRRKMELGVVHARVELPIRKTEFDLHSTGIRSQDAGKLSRLRIYLKDHSGGVSVRSGNALTPVCRGRRFA